MKRSIIKVVALGLLSSTISFANQNTKKIILPFYVPSGVTSEMSRLYINIVKDFESQNPNIDVLFNPKNN